ncbi:hypothetical protein [Cupriavidus sp. AcVe19-6a]|uniref:hypothetical protein n=1 Tax=Cupriavidus sp. AcVe19-6a TaxID=2821358 RepID=UPI001AE5C487|nr:hypothetical protein [Cupriavidus sp. AcVe19-6a]MBP0637535.1 hypothetical protein [Cupriavidus sp. AcVe19-6a]
MEELVGGRNEKVLPYAVKERFEYQDRHLEVISSETLLALENSQGRVVTLRRAIRDSQRDAKLIEVFEGTRLGNSRNAFGDGKPTYLHDAGGAKREEGFHRFLAQFLGLELPLVPTTNGGEAPLYLQTIFAALAVEQKRGWTDYIANVPFYGIRDVRTRVVEFLLGLGVFETNAARNRLNIDSLEIDADWRRLASQLRSTLAPLGLELKALPGAPTAEFDESVFTLQKLSGDSTLPVADYVAQLRSEYRSLETQADKFSKVSGTEAIEKIAAAKEELQHLTMLYERALSATSERRLSLRDFEELLAEANEDFDKNKAARKLRELGARQGLQSASGICPTCSQPVDDTLLAGMVTGPQMDLDANIAYLDSQRRMLIRQIAGVRDTIQESEVKVAELAARSAAKRDVLVAMRDDVTSGATESKAIVRRQVQIESEVTSLQEAETTTMEALRQLKGVSDRLLANQIDRKKLPKETYTEDDYERIRLFQKHFRANAGSFGYESAPIRDIEISDDNLVPCLAQMELREIRTDIKSDSSASDFVRLIWSYLLALHQTSATMQFKGNHLGVLMLDEPGQHSMAVDSQHALLKQLASESGLQSIIAASFDENEDVFKQATQNVTFKLIEWTGKLLQPLM